MHLCSLICSALYPACMPLYTPLCSVCVCVYTRYTPGSVCGLVGVLWLICQGSIFMPCYIFCVIIVSNASSLPCKPAIVVRQGNYTIEA